MQNDNFNESNNGFQIYGIILWICSVSLSMMSTYISVDAISWVDLILGIIGKLAPLVSTIFLYIINRPAIDKYFKEIFKKKFKKNKEK